MSDSTARHINEDEQERDSTALTLGHLWQLRVAEMTPAEALALLWRAATRDPYHGDMARLVDAKRILERVLERQE